MWFQSQKDCAQRAAWGANLPHFDQLSIRRTSWLWPQVQTGSAVGSAEGEGKRKTEGWERSGRAPTELEESGPNSAVSYFRTVPWGP